MQRLHPVQVEYSYHLGSRIDVEVDLPPSLTDDAIDDILETLSAPPAFVERVSPLSFEVGTETVRGKNPSDGMGHFFRVFQKTLEMASSVVRDASRTRFKLNAAASFIGVSLCPETIRRLIEFDYDNSDNVYSRFVALVKRGDVTPVATLPFHALAPQLDDFELRLFIRLALNFYWPLLKYHHRASVKKGEDLFTLVFALPEGAFTRKTMEVLHTEFCAKCDEENLPKRHLVLLLETGQVKEREIDVLMKRWHAIRPTNATRDYVSILFRDRSFTQWVTEGHPSVKKMLDRTIAKVDAFLREAGIDYLWTHMEPIESLIGTAKTPFNFQQKLIKLVELGYQPLAPDAFVRRKLNETFKREEQEPRRCQPLDGTSWNGWPTDDPNGLRRWEGIIRDEEGRPVRVDDHRPYTRIDVNGQPRTERGPQGWKPGLSASLRACHKAVVGETRTFLGGMLQLLRELVPNERIPVQRKNVEDFLIRASMIHWREHFIQTTLSEADIQLLEFAQETLAQHCDDGDVTDEQACIAGAAARAIFFAYEALHGTTYTPENFDQRLTYESAALMSLAFVDAIRAFRWAGKPDQAAALFAVFERELLQFESAYERHNLAALGVEKKDWDEAIRSAIADSQYNIVTRAARRIAARYLGALGFRDKITRTDAGLPTSCGHFWSLETGQPNLQWENTSYCGIAEE